MLRYIFWEITHRCNQRCRICHLYGQNSESVVRKELTTEENMMIIDKIAKYCPENPPKIKISGGEPMMRKDIFTLLSYIEKKQIPYGLMSNFSVMDEQSLQQLLSLNPKFLNISLDGNEVIHDYLRKTEGSYSRTLKALEYYLKNCGDVSIELNCVIQPENLLILRKIVDIAADLKVKATFQHINFLLENECQLQKDYDFKHFGTNFHHYVNKLNYYKTMDDVKLLYTKLQDILEYGKIKGVEVKIKPNMYKLDTLASYYLGSENLKFLKCSELGKMLFIQPDGTLNACFECYPIGNLLDTEIEEVLSQKKYRETVWALNECKEINPICVRCCKYPFD